MFLIKALIASSACGDVKQRPFGETVVSKPVAHRILRLLERGGQPLDDEKRAALEASLCCNLEKIRIHLGSDARSVALALGATAFTLGRHIVLGQQGVDLELLRHEAVHAVQQNFSEPMDLLWLDPVPRCEEEATAIVARGGGAVTGSAQTSVQRHSGPSCPQPPLWVPYPYPWEQLLRRAYSLGGNQAIEFAYREAHPANTVLVGSDFESFRDILLPRGVADRDMWNRFLRGLRGLVQQRKPDIVDFTERVFYEIKTPAFAVAGQVQIESYYELANQSIAPADGGGNWNRDRATWYPEHVLPFPGDSSRLVCTALTDHTLTKGLLFYQIYRQTSQDEERDLRRQMVAVSDLNSELEGMRNTLRRELIRTIEASRVPSGTELWIIASPELHETLIRRPQRERMERTLDLMRVHGWEARRNPVIGFRNLGWTVIGVAEVVMATVAICVLTGGLGLFAEGAVVAPAVGTVAAAELTTVATAATGLAAQDAVVISLAAYRAARAAPAAIQLARVAGVLLVGSVVTAGSARAEDLRVVRTVSIRAVPRADFHPDDYYEMDREVLHAGQPYRIIGKALVP